MVTGDGLQRTGKSNPRICMFGLRFPLVQLSKQNVRSFKTTLPRFVTGNISSEIWSMTDNPEEETVAITMMKVKPVLTRHP